MVSEEKIEEIKSRLKRIESIHGIQIVYAVESGSRMWGFASSDSDYDVRFLYIRPLAWYLSVGERRDVIECPIEMPFDINGWDLKKATLLLAKSNSVLFEWLVSPIVYYEEKTVTNILRKYGAIYFNAKRAIYSYLHMASGNYRMYLRDDQVKLKKYFYVLRPLLACEWIHRHGTSPPVTFYDLMEIADWDAMMGSHVHDLLERKKAGDELATGKKIEAINLWIESKIEQFTAIARTATDRKSDIDDLDEFFAHQIIGRLGRLHG